MLLSCFALVGLMCSEGFTEAPGQWFEFDCVRDLSLSSYPSEVHANLGLSPRLKLKSYQELAVIDFDVTSLKNKQIIAAELVVTPATAVLLDRVTIGAITHPWIEGTGNADYQPVSDASCFAYYRYPKERWANDAYDCTSVMLGQGHAYWHSVQASAITETKTQVVAVDPRLVSMRIAELSHGFVLFDDTGTEWKREGDKVTMFPFPNRVIYSKDQNRSVAPRLRVLVGSLGKSNMPQRMPPTPLVKPLKDPSRLLLSPSAAESRLLGYQVEVDGRKLPVYRVPCPIIPGENELQLFPSDFSKLTAQINIRAVAESGDLSEKVSVTVKKPAVPTTERVLVPPKSMVSKSTQSPTLKVVDELDLIDLINGPETKSQPLGYLQKNHLWDAAEKKIYLRGFAGESLGFQVVTQQRDARVTCKWDRPEFFVSANPVQGVMKGNKLIAEIVTDQASFTSHPKQQWFSWYVDLEIPTKVEPGIYTGVLEMQSGIGMSRLQIQLVVDAGKIPEVLSFLPEMNCYDLPKNERDYYRLGHRNRVCVNRVPYYHRGTVAAGFVPDGDVGNWDWRRWDERFGPLFNGSLFSDLPRRGVPIEVFYLPIFENWPVPIEPHYKDSYWASEALNADYRQKFSAGMADFLRHLEQKAHFATLFQFYLNGKTNFKEKGWSRGTSPWLLDEPAHFQDFFALRIFGKLFQAGVQRSGISDLQVGFRADISRPQWQREVLDPFVTISVLGYDWRHYRDRCLERKSKNRQLMVEYGGANPIGAAPVESAAWCLDVWSLGLDGVVPWQTIGTLDSWERADDLALFYPRREPALPCASLRLKAFRRAQQDCELLNQLSQVPGFDRGRVGREVRGFLDLRASRVVDEQIRDDAGRVEYKTLTGWYLHQLREQVRDRLVQLPRVFVPRPWDGRQNKSIQVNWPDEYEPYRSRPSDIK